MCLEFLKDTKTSAGEMKGGDLCSLDLHLSFLNSRALNCLVEQTRLRHHFVSFNETGLIWTS